MATPAEIANDLEARAKLLDRTHHKDHARAMSRAVDCIRNQIEKIAELERAAEAEAERYIGFVSGHDDS
jgi:hypothetical protein